MTTPAYTILTNDERPELPPTNTVPRDYFTAEQMEAYADAREAAVLAKLAQQEPVAYVPEVQLKLLKKHGNQAVVLHDKPAACGLDAALYTHPAPQADRQRVSANKAQNEFNRVIQHAITLGSEAAQFLRCWNEGNWDGCREFDFEPALPYEVEAPAQAKPCLVKGDCKHGNWCSDVYCQEHCQFVKPRQQK